MGLLGAPSSPSVVGLLVSTARVYNKEVHYEMATERLFPCNDKGAVTATTKGPEAHAARELYTAGVMRALESGVDAIGVTNLCEPLLLADLVDLSAAKTATTWSPTAVLFVAHSDFLHADVHARASSQPCWGADTHLLPRFGAGAAMRVKDPTNCWQDDIQYGLTEVWDALRANHSQVAVVGDASALTPALLKNIRVAHVATLSAARAICRRFSNILQVDPHLVELWIYPDVFNFRRHHRQQC